MLLAPSREPEESNDSMARPKPAHSSIQNGLLAKLSRADYGRLVPHLEPIDFSRGDAPVTRTNSLETVRNMVASGLGVSVLPRDALTPKYHSRLVVAVPFAKPVPSRRIALAHRKSFPRPAAVAAIREAVAACRTKKAA